MNTKLVESLVQVIEALPPADYALFQDYAFLVPYVETETEIFLKTIIPSRKATKKYLQRREE